MGCASHITPCHILSNQIITFTYSCDNSRMDEKHSLSFCRYQQLCNCQLSNVYGEVKLDRARECRAPPLSSPPMTSPSVPFPSHPSSSLFNCKNFHLVCTVHATSKIENFPLTAAIAASSSSHHVTLEVGYNMKYDILLWFKLL